MRSELDLVPLAKSRLILNLDEGVVVPAALRLAISVALRLAVAAALRDVGSLLDALPPSLIDTVPLPPSEGPVHPLPTPSSDVDPALHHANEAKPLTTHLFNRILPLNNTPASRAPSIPRFIPGYSSGSCLEIGQKGNCMKRSKEKASRRFTSYYVVDQATGVARHTSLSNRRRLVEKRRSFWNRSRCRIEVVELRSRNTSRHRALYLHTTLLHLFSRILISHQPFPPTTSHLAASSRLSSNTFLGASRARNSCNVSRKSSVREDTTF